MKHIEGGRKQREMERRRDVNRRETETAMYRYLMEKIEAERQRHR